MNIMIIRNIILKFLIIIFPIVKANNNSFIKCINNIKGGYFANINGCQLEQNNNLHCYNYTISIKNMKNIIYEGLTDLTTLKCDNISVLDCNYNWEVVGTLSYNSSRIGNTHLFTKYMNLTTYDYIKSSINKLSSECIGYKQGYFNDANLILCYDISNSNTNNCDFYQ